MSVRWLSRLEIVCALCACGSALALLSVPASAWATAPAVEEEWATEVTATSALLHAKINAEREPTTYRFEYATSESALLAGGGTAIPAPPAEGEAGEAEAVTVHIDAQGLAPATTYYVRVVARNARGERTLGEAQSLTTRPPGGEFALPDGRAWEQVSPREKDGYQMLMTGGSVSQAAEDGSAVTYTASGPFTPETAGNLETQQALSTRGPGGWSTQDISPPQAKAQSPRAFISSEYVLFSPDLTHALVEPFTQTPLSPAVTEKTLYVRNDSTGEYEAMVTPANTLPGVKVGGEEAQYQEVEVVAATPDMSHVVIKSLEGRKLTAQGTQTNERPYYYEWFDGQLRLINEDPEEGRGVEVGGQGIVRHAISDDGSRIVWTSEENGPLFLSELASGKVTYISAAQGVAEPPPFGGSGLFQDASSDGSKVFFTTDAQLTTVPGGGLYVYEVESGKLTLLTPTVHEGEAAEVKTVIPGVSEDGSYVYLVAEGVLSSNENGEGERATTGADNLYVLHSQTNGGVTEWKTTFIATLASEDAPDWGSHKVGAGYKMGKLTSRVSPDGRYLAFMSDRSLTGYDNVDALSGRRDEEVYLYDAQSGRLVCASCNPTGERPVGYEDRGGEASGQTDLGGAWPGRWLAASVPGWFQAGFTEHNAYQPRYLSDSGRLFFDSADALVPQATNGTDDVYEYEPEGIGSCAGSSATYSARAGGCVGLISGGTGAQESVFVDASASGNDVFFVTAEGLVPGDEDGLYDVYDAHACSAEAPCPAPEAPSSPPCDTGESCKAPPSPQPAIFGSPASATFSGAGNVAQGVGAPPAQTKKSGRAVRCAKGRTLRRGKCVRARAGKRVRRSGRKSERRRSGR